MNVWELFKKIAYTDYKTIGAALDYTIEIIDGRAFLFFQSSNQGEDWLHNFDFVRTVYKNQRNHMIIHHGYAKTWKSANDQIIAEFIAATRVTNKQPVIAGWSFGGAMALLAAEDYNYRTSNKALVFTFGAPKIAGDKKTAEYIKSCGTFTQYAQRCDIVTKMPPLPWFHHINKVDLGRRFNIIEIFKPQIYHTEYGQPELYGEINDTSI